jgi:putative ABC transport system permease protein
MLLRDSLHLALGSIIHHRLRSFLTALGITVGITAVVLLTAIGEGIHRFVLAEFTQFGTHIVGITPGKTTTAGISGAIIGNVRPLTLDDAQALRRLPHIEGAVAVVQGNASVEAGSRSRRVTVYGAGHEAPEVWNFGVSLGQFLPDDDPTNARSLAVLGDKLRKELFGQNNPLGKIIRVAGYRYRVIGVMEPKGQLLGFDLDDAIYLPTARAMEIFNQESVMEIDLLYSSNAEAEHIVDQATKLLNARHGHEDFTIITQEQMLETLGSILDILTMAVAAIGGISLLVGGIGILTIMTIAINERTNEIGLLRAIGATRQQILLLFLGEAIVLGALGGFIGLVIGAGGAQLIHWLVPALPTHVSGFYIGLAELTAIAIGLAAGVAPARNAARLDPIEALRAE